MSQQLGQARSAHPSVRHYTLMAFFALLLLLLALIDQDLGLWALLPVVVGTAATLTHRERVGPPLVLALVAGLLLAASQRWRLSESELAETSWSELVIAVSLLVYSLAHYRLLALMRHIFPLDLRRRLGRSLSRPRRSPALVTSEETAWLLVLAPACLVAALLGWVELQVQEPPLSLSRRTWQGIVLVWMVVGTLALLSAATAYLRRAQAGPEESLLYLQDQLWRDLRREQAEVQRWTAWLRLRLLRRKEKS